MITYVLLSLVDVYPVAYKDYIAKTDIRNLYEYNYRNKRINGYVYDRQFINKMGKYNYQSFDEFCFFHINRIRNVFFQRAVEYGGNKQIFENMFFITKF